MYKGNYEKSLSAGVRHSVPVMRRRSFGFMKVGTATMMMMASKAIKPVYQVFSDAGIKFDESQFVPTVSGYYTDSKRPSALPAV